MPTVSPDRTFGPDAAKTKQYFSRGQSTGRPPGLRSKAAPHSPASTRSPAPRRAAGSIGVVPRAREGPESRVTLDIAPDPRPQFPRAGLPPGASAEPRAYGAAGPSTHTPQPPAFPLHLRWKAAAPGTPTIASAACRERHPLRPTARVLRRRRPGPAPAELARTSAAAAVRPRAAPPPDGPGTPPPRTPAPRPTHAEARPEGAHAKHHLPARPAPSAPGCVLSWSGLHLRPASRAQRAAGT